MRTSFLLLRQSAAYSAGRIGAETSKQFSYHQVHRHVSVVGSGSNDEPSQTGRVVGAFVAATGLGLYLGSGSYLHLRSEPVPSATMPPISGPSHSHSHSHSHSSTCTLPYHGLTSSLQHSSISSTRGIGSAISQPEYDTYGAKGMLHSMSTYLLEHLRSLLQVTPLMLLPRARCEEERPKGGGRILTENSFSNAAEKVVPAVVNVTVTQNGAGGMVRRQSSGSGFILSSDGFVLTNAHVVLSSSSSSSSSSRVPRPPRETVTVATQDGRSFEAKVVSFDVVADLALLKVESSVTLPCAKLGSSSSLRVGQWVLALGSPLSLQNSVTAGIISCVDRKGREIGLRGAPMEYIQTDCAINQGNSGGPLVDLNGEVVGVNTMKALAADGVSFAVPVDIVKQVVSELRSQGRVVRPYLGLRMLELTPAVAAQIRDRDVTFPRDINQGVLVPQVMAGSPAEKAGVQSGDVIVEFGGHPVTSVRNIIDTLGFQAGKTFDIKILRAGDVKLTLKITSTEASW